MRIAALYDIHGNLPALEAVLEEVRADGTDRIVVGGDVVPGPMAGEALDLLLGLRSRRSSSTATVSSQCSHKSTPGSPTRLTGWVIDGATVYPYPSSSRCT